MSIDLALDYNIWSLYRHDHVVLCTRTHTKETQLYIFLFGQGAVYSFITTSNPNEKILVIIENSRKLLILVFIHQVSSMQVILV